LDVGLSIGVGGSQKYTCLCFDEILQLWRDMRLP